MKGAHSRSKTFKLAAFPVVGLLLTIGLAAWLFGSPLGESPAAQATGPHLSATKDCSLSDGVFTFTFTVTNDGDTPLIRWKVEDTTLGSITWEFPETLAVGQKVTVTLTKLQLPGDGLCNWAELSYRTASWEVVKARPNCCVGTPTPPPPGSVTLPKYKQVGEFTKPTLVCFQLEVKTNGFVPSPDPPEGAEQCKVPDAAGNATFTWTNLPPGDYRIVETKEVCEVKGVVQDPCTVYAPLPPIPFTMPDPPQAIALPKVENRFEATKKITKQNADGTLWTGPDVTFHICAGSVPTCDPTSPTFERSVVIPRDGNPFMAPEPEGTYTVCEVPPPNFTVEPSECQTKDVLAAMVTDFVFKNIPPGGEGCTPGYWKQPAHFHFWTPPYDPPDKFSDVFGRLVTVRAGGHATITDPTLLQALEATGGGIDALVRHGVAALLSAASPGVSYAFSPAAVIAMVQAAIDSGDYDTTKDLLKAENERGCPLD